MSRSRIREEPGEFVEDVSPDRADAHWTDLPYRSEIGGCRERQHPHVDEPSPTEPSPEGCRQQAAPHATGREALDSIFGKVVEERLALADLIEQGRPSGPSH